MKLSRLLIFISLTTACGVKTSPHSNVIETRPVIPFKEKSSPKKTKDKDVEKVPNQEGLEDGSKP